MEKEIPIIYVRHKEIKQALKCDNCHKWGAHVIDIVQVECPHCQQKQTKDLTKREEDEVVNKDSVKDHIWMTIKELENNNEIIIRVKANENYKIRFFEDAFKRLGCKIKFHREFQNLETNNYTQYGKFEDYILYRTEQLIYYTE